jgi:hypothetical protein
MDQHFCLPASPRGLLEPDAVKVARPVLRGAERSNALGLPGGKDPPFRATAPGQLALSPGPKRGVDRTKLHLGAREIQETTKTWRANAHELGIYAGCLRPSPVNGWPSC